MILWRDKAAKRRQIRDLWHHFRRAKIGEFENNGRMAWEWRKAKLIKLLRNWKRILWPGRKQWQRRDECDRSIENGCEGAQLVGRRRECIKVRRTEGKEMNGSRVEAWSLWGRRGKEEFRSSATILFFLRMNAITKTGMKILSIRTGVKFFKNVRLENNHIIFKIIEFSRRKSIFL